MSGLPVFVKGVMCAEDAYKAIGAGADGIYVTNHGGREVDGAPATIDVLPEIVTTVCQSSSTPAFVVVHMSLKL